jgi:hypothetical protein
MGGVTWGKLQHVKAGAVIEAMLRLACEHRVLALPVHDSPIVPTSAERVACDVLRPEAKALASPIAATRAVAITDPIPGTAAERSRAAPSRAAATRRRSSSAVRSWSARR